jgi:ABC-2 type transport system permease protein
MTTLALARATLRGTTWLSTDGLRELARRERLWVLPVAVLGTAAGLAAYTFMLVGLYRSLLAAGLAAGHPEIVLFYALLGSWAFTFVTAIPLALSVLYYSHDLRLLLTLPVRPMRIVAAKAAVLYLSCMPLNLLFLVPALWLYVAAVGAPAAAVVSAVVHLVVSPAFPLGVAALLVQALVKAVNLSRRRVALEVAGMGVGVALVLGLQIVLSRSAMSTLGGGTFEALNRFPDLFGSIARALPPVAWAAQGFAPGAGFLPILLSLAVTAAACAAALLLAPLGFQRDVTERRQPARRRGASAFSSGVPAAGKGSVTRALLGREWAVLASSSTYLFEAFAEVLVMPLLLGVYSLLIPKQYLGLAMGFIAASPLASLIIMAVLVLMTSLTTVSATSISREGRLFAISLAVPVSGRRQVGAKLLLHMILFTSAYLLDLAICLAVFRFPPVSLVYMVPGGIALQMVSFAAGMAFDLKRPLLKWTHPQQAMKNNMNAGAGIGLSFAVVAVLGALCAALVLAGAAPFLVGCIAAAAGIALAALAVPRVLSYADRRYAGGLEMQG